VCVEKSGTFKFRISGVHHSLAKQDKFNGVSYEILPHSGTCSLACYKTKRSPLNYITDRQRVYCAVCSDSMLRV